MAVYDINETSLRLYRIVDPQGAIVGYAIEPCGGVLRSEPIEVLDPGVDLIEQVRVHLFPRRAEAEAFQQGLILAGERPGAFSSGECEDGWVVVRELNYPPDDGDSTVQVITFVDKPRVLIEIRGGKTAVFADGGLDICVVDYDREPASEVPARFRDLLA